MNKEKNKKKKRKKKKKKREEEKQKSTTKLCRWCGEHRDSQKKQQQQQQTLTLVTPTQRKVLFLFVCHQHISCDSASYEHLWSKEYHQST